MLLKLQGPHRRDGLEVMVKAGHAHPKFARDLFLSAKETFRARVAADSIKPGVERSETPGLSTQKTCRAREAADEVAIANHHS
jgi:hypothetical protein